MQTCDLAASSELTERALVSLLLAAVQQQRSPSLSASCRRRINICGRSRIWLAWCCCCASPLASSCAAWQRTTNRGSPRLHDYPHIYFICDRCGCCLTLADPAHYGTGGHADHPRIRRRRLAHLSEWHQPRLSFQPANRLHWQRRALRRAALHVDQEPAALHRQPAPAAAHHRRIRL